MAPELSHPLPPTPPSTPTESSEPVAYPAHPAHSAPALDQGQQAGLRGGKRLFAIHKSCERQGNQQITNKNVQEAFSYVNQVKVQFVDQPDTFKTFLQVLKNYKSQEIDARGMANRVSELLTGHPNLIQGFNIFAPPGYEIGCDASNDPKAICASSYPLARDSMTPTQTAQGFGTNSVAPQQPGAAAKDTESFDLSTMMHPCSTTLPIPQRLAISMQPPSFTRPEIELYPPIVVRLLQPEDMPNVWAIATLFSDGRDVTDQLRGALTQSPLTGTFCFSGLKIYKQGIYCVRISLYQTDFYSCPKVAACVGFVDSNDILIAPRPDVTIIRRSIVDVTAAQHPQCVRQPLLHQTVDANTCIDDHTGYFPNLKIHAGLSVITIGLIQYLKYMILIPVSNFQLETANLDHGLYNLGDGLFRGEDGVWYDNGEVEWAKGLDESIMSGEDGEMYRRRTDGVFNDLFVGLERKVTIVDNVGIYIAHNVLIS